MEWTWNSEDTQPCSFKVFFAQNFNITGGSDGVVVNRGSNAVINNNNIHDTGGNGVTVEELAFAVLTNNTIEGNLDGAGILVNEKSTARIGFNSDTETTASANTIQNNAVGIIVSHGSSARIIGNDISNNSGDGIDVLRDSQADIASNTINGNGDDGIEVGEDSFVQLGEDSGATIYDLPNTTTANNAGRGVKCTTGGVADGRRGTLMGALGATNLDASCINDLNP